MGFFDLKKFFAFYMENKDKIEQKIPTHPLNENAFIDWINLHIGKSLSPKEVSEMAEIHKPLFMHDEKEIRYIKGRYLNLIKHENISDPETYELYTNVFKSDTMLYEKACLFRQASRHVSYNEFISQIGKIAADIRMKAINYDNVVLVLHNKIDKSNFWMSMILYGMIYDVLTHISDSNIQSINSIREYEELDSTTLLIIPDDASYSGQQYRENLGFQIAEGYFYNFKEERHKTTIYCAIPYISEQAKKLLDEFTLNIGINLIYGPYEKFKSFTKFLMDNSHSEYINGSDLRNPLHTIYFDHKLADSISIYQLIYALGVPLYSINPNNIKLKSLITGCDYSKHPVLNNYSPDILDLQRVGGSTNMCPKPFYKTIQYTFDGETIYKLTSLLNN